MSVKNLILEAYRHQNKDELLLIQKELNVIIETLDTFFEEYLEVFSDQMSATEDQKSPVWIAYKDKYKESQDAKENLKLTNYYLGML